MVVIIDMDKVEEQLVSDAGASGLLLKKIFTAENGGRLHCNLGRILPGGTTRKHKHKWDQLNFVLNGEGMFKTSKNNGINIKKGVAVYIPGNEMHFFENTGSEPLEILGVLGPMTKSE